MKKHQIWLTQVSDPPVHAGMISPVEGFLSYLLTCRKFAEYCLLLVGNGWLMDSEPCLGLI